MKRNQHKITYHNNRHRSDGMLLDAEQNDNNLNNNDYTDQNVNVTQENLNEKNNYLNSFNSSENYLNEKYEESSSNLINELNDLFNNLSEPLSRQGMVISTENSSKKFNLKLDDENMLLSQENYKLEEKINYIKAKISGNVNNEFESEENTTYGYDENLVEEELTKLFKQNQKLMNENAFLKRELNKLKSIRSKSSSLFPENNKYRMDCLVQSMVGTMKELVFLFEQNESEIEDFNDNSNNSNHCNNRKEFVSTSNNGISDEKECLDLNEE